MVLILRRASESPGGQNFWFSRSGVSREFAFPPAPCPLLLFLLVRGATCGSCSADGKLWLGDMGEGVNSSTWLVYLSSCYFYPLYCLGQIINTSVCEAIKALSGSPWALQGLRVPWPLKFVKRAYFVPSPRCFLVPSFFPTPLWLLIAHLPVLSQLGFQELQE